MSNESATVIRDTRKHWMIEHRGTYLRSGGVEGHVMDLTAVGGHSFGTHCLIRYRGRSSGKVFITPLSYGAIGGEVVVCASKGGADHHPEWYLNIRDSAQIDFQIATQAFRGSWREPEGAERAKVWGFLVDCYPFYANYQAATARVLPLVMMRAIEAIPVFREEDATGIRQF